MIREFFKKIYYFLYQLFFGNFLLLRIAWSNKVFVIKKKNLEFFSQNIRNLNDLNTLRQIFIKEEYKFPKAINSIIFNEYCKIIENKKTPLIIDCGANICASVNYFSSIYNNSEIVGIEPDNINFTLCEKNKIKKSKIHLIKTAVSCDNFNYDINKKNDDGRSSYIKLDGNNLDGRFKENKTITVKNILETFQTIKYQPFIIKIDIEGHEKKLFEKNTEWMNYFKFIIIELHDWMLPEEDISSNFHKALKENITSYDMYNFGENTLIVNKS